jgi:AraC-like DNA-binding protein
VFCARGTRRPGKIDNSRPFLHDIAVAYVRDTIKLSVKPKVPAGEICDPQTMPSAGVWVANSREAAGSFVQYDDEFARIQLLTEGQIKWKAGDRQYLLGPKSICHVPARLPCARQILPNGAVALFSVTYRPQIISGAFSGQPDLGLLFVNLDAPQSFQSLRAIFQEMIFEQEAKKEGWELILCSRLIDVAARVLRLARRRVRGEVTQIEAGSESRDRVARYALRLRSQFFQQISVNDAARSTGLARRQFTNRFREVTGQNWRQYVASLRLRHAAGLLVETDLSAAAVAFESGFEDLSHFHHCFKVAYGCSPVAYRNQRRVLLPSETRPIPEPLPLVAAAPGFKYRGTKGWGWTPEQYLEEIPVLADYKMNFLMNCHLSLFGRAQTGELKNEWWKPLPAGKKAAFVKVIMSCRRHAIVFCFATYPQLSSPRPLNPADPSDVDLLFAHYAWAQSQGVKWFSVLLDCFGWGNHGPASGGLEHAHLVNSILQRLRQADPEAQIVMGPGLNWGEGSNVEQRAYLEAIGNELHPDAYIFWGGDGSVTQRVSRLAAESYRDTVKHRLFLWDNYPVNDGYPTLHLGPLTGRDPSLCEVIDGYMSNPMATQNQINRIPLATCADYAYNPMAYNPIRSIGQAILRWAKTEPQQLALKELVEAYPGFLVIGGGTRANAIRARLEALLKAPESRGEAETLVGRMEKILERLERHFPDLFSDARRTVRDDIAWIKSHLGNTL